MRQKIICRGLHSRGTRERVAKGKKRLNMTRKNYTGFHTDGTEGEIRDGALEDEAEGRWLKMNTTGQQHNEMDLCMTRAGDVY